MYRRFLNQKDYLGIITQTALEQITRGDNTRFEQAEQAAEASVIDYLSENYEVEKELNKGKYIAEYDNRINYPIGSHFYFEGEICEVIKAINGYKAPSSIEYWAEVEEYRDLEQCKHYSQMVNYQEGEEVVFLNRVFVCLNANGIDFNNIRIPGVDAWNKVEVYEWNAIPYSLWEVVQYEGDFFTLISTDDYEPLTNPMESDNWGKIGEYDPAYNKYSMSLNEYVVYNGEVFFPAINPNFDTPALGCNIRHHDPRNYNLKRHMVQLSLYELHKLISPNNISTVRIDDFNHSMQWLRDAARLKLNPQIPRKVGENKMPVTDWQMATFQTDYNPENNMWHI